MVLYAAPTLAAAAASLKGTLAPPLDVARRKDAVS